MSMCIEIYICTERERQMYTDDNDDNNFNNHNFSGPGRRPAWRP